MKFYILTFFMGLSPLFIQAAEFKSDFDLEKLDKMVEDDRVQARKDIKEREGIDGPWMIRLFVDYRKGKQVTDEELQRVWEIYEKEKSHRIEDKLYAFSLIAEFEDISKWQKEFDSLALSEDPKFVKTAIETVMWKLDRGTERERIIISNKTVVLARLVKFAEDNKADTTIHRDAVKIIELAKPYVGKSPPAEAKRPDRRPSDSPATGTPVTDERTPDSSTVGSLMQRICKGGSLTFAGIIGIIIAAILIWRWKSK